jgi:hypothetical protein
MAKEKVSFQCIADEIHCGKKFEAGEWECFSGVPHQVEPRSYYMADAPHCDFERDKEGLVFRKARTNMQIVPDEIRLDHFGKQITVSHPTRTFVSGQYSTSDPQEQFHLEHGNAKKSLCSYERWFDVYHTPKQKQNIRDGKLAERERALDEKATRLEKENNDLLSRIQKHKKPEVLTA